MIHLVVFDMDGTVFSNSLNWEEIRRRLEVGESHLLQTLYGKTDPESTKKMTILEEYERINTFKARPRRGVHRFLSFLKKNGIRTALVTNNSLKNTEYLLDKFSLTFQYILTREKGLWKPDPAPIRHVLDHFNVCSRETAVIGDSYYDIKASTAAGISRIYILRSQNTPVDPCATIVSGFRSIQSYLLNES